MLNEKQCELARVLTGDTTCNLVINQEFATMSRTAKDSASKEIDGLVKLHNAPIDKCLGIITADFRTIAKKYNISAATLFCVYMERLSN